MLYKELVKNCDTQVNNCRNCNYKMDCISLQRSGIPKPYQYHSIKTASILDKEVSELMRTTRF